MTNTCSIKLLKNTYIGAGMRMSSGSNTVPFDNKPMTGLIIENYSKQGFRISHENLPKSVWVDFDQLPLTRLKIENGVIEDEITFVENIVNHRMQLIRTLDTEYIDLLYAEKALADKEKGGEIISIREAEPGYVYIGAQCKENIPMIYLGTWFTKGVFRNHKYNFGYHRAEKDTFFLEKQSPERAFFLIDTEELSRNEKNKIEALTVNTIERDKDEDWNDYYERQDRKRKRVNKLQAELKKKLLAEGPAERWKILAYPVTSKRVKKLIKTPGYSTPLFKDKVYNRELILTKLAPEDGNYYGQKASQGEDLIELKPTYPSVETKGFKIVTPRYGTEKFCYLTDSKNDIDNNAYKFINENFKITLESNKLSDYRNLVDAKLV